MSIKTSKTLDFQLVKLINKKTLNQANIANNNNKYYILEFWQSPDGCCLKSDYGRVDVSSTIDYRYGSYEECEKEFDRILKEKIKKGYRIIETEDVIEKKAIISKTAESKIDIPPNILKLIEYMFGQTTSYVSRTCLTPIGKLSLNQINNGKGILKEIDSLLDKIPNSIKVNSELSLFDKEKIIKKSGKTETLEKLCSDYYSTIPQKLSNNIRGFENLIKDGDDLAKQEDLLRALEDLLGVQDVIVSDNIIDKYKAFEAKFDLPDLENKSRIEKWFNDSKSHHHKANMKILDIISIKRKDDDKTWDKDIAKIKTQEVFHGTRNQNLLGICSRGLMLPGNHSAIKNGANFGTGIYGALHSSKSAQYCGDNFRSSGNQWMFVLDLAVGKQYVYTGWVSGYWKGIPKEYHSTWAKSGNGLLHDELIVYDKKQAKLTHMINFESKW
jgi:predicted DNA-binding WGR domain protein